MADDFDRFLAENLAPPEREPDWAFVRLVQSRIAVEDRLSAERRALLSGLLLKMVALAAFAAGLAWLGRAPDVASLAAESPAILLAALLAGFGFFVFLLSLDKGRATGFRQPLAPLLAT